ncbi:unnamed protein product [Brassica rapa]|uniref:Uncharacterized protein n=1 Tax=Brassica campestris TaxID=3711 RepID=A0A3P6CBH4_BRACM|nr:unnamed protein product [Brassica rapa]VDD10384.1 unnamed protein product [Brassica rapa]
MAGKPFRPPPRPPIPPDFGFPISDLPLNSQKFPPLLPHSPRSSLAPNKFSTMSSPWTLPSLPSSSFAPSALVDLSSPTTALSISTPSVTLAVEQTPITILVLPAGDSACEAPVDLGPSPPSNHAVEPSPNSDQFSDPISLDPDGSIISPPSSPRSPSSPRAPSPFDPNGLHPFSPPSSDSTSVPFNNDNPIPHPAKITHLLALPAVHHPRPVKTRSPKNLLPHFTTESKFPLSVNPFACLDPELLPPPTLPVEGSLLLVGVNPTQ